MLRPLDRRSLRRHFRFDSADEALVFVAAAFSVAEFAPTPAAW